MGFAIFLLFLAGGVAILLGIEFVLRKWLKVQKVNLAETKGKNINRWGKGIILVMALSLFSFALNKDAQFLLWYWLIYLIIDSLFEALLQWKYARESRAYLLTLSFLPFTIAPFLIFWLWMSELP